MIYKILFVSFTFTLGMYELNYSVTVCTENISTIQLN